MTFSELAKFIDSEMRMSQVYQPVFLALLLESEGGLITEAEAEESFRQVLDREPGTTFDVRRERRLFSYVVRSSLLREPLACQVHVLLQGLPHRRTAHPQLHTDVLLPHELTQVTWRHGGYAREWRRAPDRPE